MDLYGRLSRVGLAAALITGSGQLAAQVIASQTLTTDTQWLDVDEPYEIAGDVTVDSGATLILGPGVTLRFASGASLIVNGALDAQGTAEVMIRFERLDPASAWGQIRFGSGSASSQIRHAVVRGGAGCLSIRGTAESVHTLEQVVVRECASDAISVYSGPSVRIASSLLAQNNGRGIYTNSAATVIEHTVIVDNRSDGIYAYRGAPAIRHNTIDRNGGDGLRLSYLDAAAQVDNNLVTRNERGWSLAAGSADFARGYNNVWGNVTDYSGLAAADTDLSSDPEYVDPDLGDRHLTEGSPSAIARSDGGELGAYGDGLGPAGFAIDYATTDLTTAGSLTRNERWSGEIMLTDNVTVDWPWRLVIDPDTRIRVPDR